MTRPALARGEGAFRILIKLRAPQLGAACLCAALPRHHPSETRLQLSAASALLAAANALELADAPQLRSLGGLSTQAQIGDLVVSNAPLFDNLGTAFTSGASIVRSLRLDQLPALKSLGPLQRVQRLDTLTITTCDGLVDLSGLGGLQTVGTFLVSNCANLQTLKGLDALESATDSLGLDTGWS